MIDKNETFEVNIDSLIQGFWYSELPNIFAIDTIKSNLSRLLDSMEYRLFSSYSYDDDGFIIGFSRITAPKYTWQDGTEPIVFYDTKNNGSLREMQIPNLIHYLAFVYNTMFSFNSYNDKRRQKAKQRIV